MTLEQFHEIGCVIGDGQIIGGLETTRGDQGGGDLLTSSTSPVHDLARYRWGPTASSSTPTEATDDDMRIPPIYRQEWTKHLGWRAMRRTATPAIAPGGGR